MARELIRRLAGRLRGRDMALRAAAVTFYGGIAVVPVALVTIRLAALLAGAGTVRRLTEPALDALPDTLGAAAGARALVEAGVMLGPLGVVAAVIPASLYGEGLRRAFVSVFGPGEKLIGWRGRLLVLPLLAAGPGLLLALLLALAPAVALLNRGGWAAVGGIVVSFLATWVVLSAVLTWVFGVVGPYSPGRPALAVGASFTAANLSGFLHGFILFWYIPVDLGLPFGGFDAIGAVVAVALWLYLLHLVVLVGYVLTVPPRGQARPESAVAPSAAPRRRAGARPPGGPGLSARAR
jgi:membrane protein